MFLTFGNLKLSKRLIVKISFLVVTIYSFTSISYISNNFRLSSIFPTVMLKTTINNFTKAKVFIMRSNCSCKKDIVLLEKHEQYYVVQVINELQEVKLHYTISRIDLQAKITCGIYNVLRRGPSQKVIGYSLYGSNSLYYNKLNGLTKTIQKMYPGWLMRVYYDNSVNKSIICDLECQTDDTNKLIDNSDFCYVNQMQLTLEQNEYFNAYYIHAMKWRWFPIGDSFVDFFASRDTDSDIIQREVDSVNYLIDSNKAGHIMRDHPQHGVDIVGGMWGFYSKRNRILANKIFNLIIDPLIASKFNANLNKKGNDQDFLSKYVYHLIKHMSVMHDSYSCENYGGTPFPTQRIGNCYIASSNCNLSASSFYACPEKCRPAKHLDWTTC